MGQVLHRSATTTEAVRRAIQRSQESLRALARRHGHDCARGARMPKANAEYWNSKITRNCLRDTANIAAFLR